MSTPLTIQNNQSFSFWEYDSSGQLVLKESLNWSLYYSPPLKDTGPSKGSTSHPKIWFTLIGVILAIILAIVGYYIRHKREKRLKQMAAQLSTIMATQVTNQTTQERELILVPGNEQPPSYQSSLQIPQTPPQTDYQGNSHPPPYSEPIRTFTRYH